MDRSTHDLINELKKSQNAVRYHSSNSFELGNNSFSNHLNDLLYTKKMTKPMLAASSDINKKYIYELFINEEIRPSRDIVIKLAFGLNLTLDELNFLLKKADHSSLYPRIKREAVIIHCILTRKNLLETNILLRGKSLEILG